MDHFRVNGLHLLSYSLSRNTSLRILLVDALQKTMALVEFVFEFLMVG
jgi:hypothetical protein